MVGSFQDCWHKPLAHSSVREGRGLEPQATRFAHPPAYGYDRPAFHDWSGWLGLNQRPPAPEAGALPLRYTQMVEVAGFEPTTSCSQSKRATNLRHTST